jgi:hypothetical protein
MLNDGCSAAKISAGAMYSAAHCYYETFTPPNGWRCATGNFGGCTEWPQVRFGVNGSNGFTGWTASGCDKVFINTAFMSLTTSTDDYTFATWDSRAST